MNALFVSLRDIKMLEEDSVLIDIGGEITEVEKSLMVQLVLWLLSLLEEEK